MISGYPFVWCRSEAQDESFETAVRADIDANGLIAPIVGHVGGGNSQLLFALRSDDMDERMRTEVMNHRMTALAIEEHGVLAVVRMRAVKRCLIPAAS